MANKYTPPQDQVLPEYKIDYVKLHKANRDKVVKRFKDEFNVSKGVVFLKGRKNLIDRLTL